MKKLVLLLFWAVAQAVLAQNTPVLVKDIATGADQLPFENALEFGPFGSNLIANGTVGNLSNLLWKTGLTGQPSLLSADMKNAFRFTELNGSTYFFRPFPDNSTHELWKADATTGQISLVKKVVDMFFSASPPDALVKAGNLLFFEGYDAAAGNEVWRSDGTAAGTFLLKDVAPGAAFSYTSAITAFGSKVIFFANENTGAATSKISVWASDGTSAGTIKLKEFLAADNNFSGQTITRITAGGTSLAYFVANDGVSGAELWKTDGTAAGTSLVRDINPGAAGSQPFQLTALGNSVIFYAQDPTNGCEVWRSDGTSTGTIRIKQTTGAVGIPVSADFPIGMTSPMRSLGGQAWFFYVTQNGANFQIEACKTDGTTTGTTVVKTQQTTDGAYVSGDDPLIYARFAGDLGGQMGWFFKNSSSTTDFELWKSNGTTSTVVKSGIPFVQFSPAAQSAGGAVFFATGSSSSSQLWRSDGTAAGTGAVSLSGSKGTNPAGFVGAGGRVFFKTDENPTAPGYTVRKQGIASSDGTAAGTSFSDQKDSIDTYYSLTSVGSDMYFLKRNSTPFAYTDLYKITPPNLTPVFVISGASGLVSHKNKVFFIKSGQIWVSAGTLQTTFAYFTPPAAPQPNYLNLPAELVSNGDSLYFQMCNCQQNGPNSTGDLWSISGNANDPGKFLRKDIWKNITGGGGSSGISSEFLGNNGRAFIKTLPGGSAGGNFFQGGLSVIAPGFPVISSGSQTVNGGYLNATPGIASNRFLVLTNEELRSFGPPIVFKNELWAATAGSPAASVIKTFAANGAGAGTKMGIAGSFAFFAADDGAGAGPEFWRSDGTSGGTIFLKDINPGAAGSKIGNFAASGNLIYFSAFDGSNWAVWQSDGSTGGTSKLANFPTTTPVSPMGQLFVNGNTLYFSGNDGAIGAELWKIALATPPPPTCANNLLTNPSFESPLTTGWGYGQGTRTIVPGGFSGNALKLDFQAFQLQTVAAEAGATYNLTAKVKYTGTFGATTMVLGTKFMDANYNQVGTNSSVNVPQSAANWTDLTLTTIVAPTGAKWIELILNCNAFQNTSLFVDDVCLTKNGVSPTPCSPDVTPPVFASCPASQNLTIPQGGSTTATATWTNPTATDACGAVTLTSNFASGAAFPIGTTNVIFMAKDAANNISICNFLIDVTQTGSNTCIGNLLKNPGFENDLADWFGTGGEIGSAPNVATGSKSLKMCTSGTSIRQTLPATAAKNYKFQYTAKTAGANQNILFGLKFLSATWQPLATEFSSFDSPTAFSTNFIQKTAPAGTAWVEVSMTKQNAGCVFLDDLCLTDGGTTTNPCSPDVTPPVISNCPASQNLTIPQGGSTTAIATFSSPTATDNCTGAVTLTSNFASGAAFPIGATTVIFTAKDAANNTSTCSFVVNVAASSGGGLGADLELTMTADKTNVPQWGNFMVTLTVKNAGNQPVTAATINVAGCAGTGSNVAFDQSFKVVWNGTPGAPTAGNFNFITQIWTLTNLAPGATAVLKLPLFTTGTAERRIVAQVTSQSPNDVDSQPSVNFLVNCTPAQDDEAVWTINAGQSGQAVNPLSNGAKQAQIADFQIYPNPTDAFCSLNLGQFLGKKVQVSVVNPLGKTVFLEQLNELDQPYFDLDLSSESNGVYFIKIDAEGYRAVVKRLIISKL